MKRYYLYLILTAVLLLPLLSLLNLGLPVSHDGKDHVARFASFYMNLEHGILIPRWGANLNWGYGHPVLMFLYPFPSYLGALFHILGFSFIDSLKLVFASSYIASGIFSFLWLRKIVKGSAAFLGAIIYTFAPYRFVDLYVRGAIGEHVAFVFLPAILWSIEQILSSKRTEVTKIVGSASLTALFTALLILSHNALSLMFLPFAGVYLLVRALFQKQKYKKLLIAGISLVYGFALSAFFWFPAFFEGKYTLRDIVASDEYKSRFVEIKDFIWGEWNYGITGEFTTQLGIISIVTIILGIFVLIKTKENHKRVLLGMTLVVMFFTLFMMTSYSDFIWQKVSLLQKFQFPWRFLSLTVATLALVSAISADYVKSKGIIILLIFIAIAVTVPYWKPKEYKRYPENFFSQIYEGTTDTGESSPIWSIRFMEQAAEKRVEVIYGDAQIIDYNYYPTERTYTINAEDPSRIRDNTLYFPGWEVFVNNEKKEIEFQDPQNRGLITYTVESGKNNVVVLFSNTKVREFAEAISLLSSFTLLSFIFVVFKSKKAQNIIKKI